MVAVARQTLGSFGDWASAQRADAADLPFEDGQIRVDGTSRVVRVGTHALRPTDQTTLWGRLRRHRGRIGGRNPGGGNHRASIFRGHVGTALIQRDHLPGALLDSWASSHPSPG